MPALSANEDKGAEALSESSTLATSRPAEVMLFLAVGWLITSCCFLGAPLAMLGSVYLVKRYRGEPVAP